MTRKILMWAAGVTVCLLAFWGLFIAVGLLATDLSWVAAMGFFVAVSAIVMAGLYALFWKQRPEPVDEYCAPGGL